MWRATICFSLALALGVPVLCHAQADKMDNQDPSRYTDEDSQALNIVSYPLRPIGFVLEWTIARPLKWLASSSPAAPVLGADIDKVDSQTVQPIAELPPPDTISSGPQTPADTEITPAGTQSSRPTGYGSSRPLSAQPNDQTPRSSQPALQH